MKRTPDDRLDSLSMSLRQSIQDAVRAIASGERIETSVSPAPLPFSRASAADYERLLELWNGRGAAHLEGLDARECPACSSRNHRLLFRSYDNYPFHVCGDCGTLFVPYAVDDTVIEAFQSEVPEARTIANRMMVGREDVTRDSDRRRFSGYFDMIRPMLADVPGPLRYLDIGCGVGHSVELAAERGFEAVGIEVNEAALATARTRGRNVHHPDQWSSSKPFHLISLFETLEHVTHPDRMIALAQKMLAPGGILLITIPNGACWEVQLMRDRCFHAFGGFENVGHINLFTPAGIEKLLGRFALSLQVADGQFSNNPLEIASTILELSSGAPALGQTLGHGRTLAMPAQLLNLLNAVGPDLAGFDRATLRSPILIAVACRREDAETLHGRAETMRAERAQILTGSLNKLPEGSAATEPSTIAPVPLFGDGRTAIEGFHDPAFAYVLDTRGLFRDTSVGLSIRCTKPVQFEYIEQLGRGRLAPGRYELAAHATMRTGRVSISLLDERRQAWTATFGLGPGEERGSTEFTLDEETDCILYVCAHNSDAPAPIDMQLQAAGIATIGGRGGIVRQARPRVVTPPAKIFIRADARPLPDFIAEQFSALLAVTGDGQLHSGLNLRSATPVRYDQLMEIGSGWLTAGQYELAGQAVARIGRISLNLRDDTNDTWVAAVALPEDGQLAGTSFDLPCDMYCTLFVCADNARSGQLDADLLAAGLAAAAPPSAAGDDNRRVPVLQTGAPPLDGVPGATIRVVEEQMITKPDVQGGYIARGATTKLKPGRYRLIVSGRVAAGRAAVSAFGETSQLFLATTLLDRHARTTAVEFELAKPETVQIIVSGANDRPTDTVVILRAAEIRNIPRASA